MERKYNVIIKSRGMVDVNIMGEIVVIDNFLIDNIDTFCIFSAFEKYQTSLLITNNDKLETIHLDSSCKVKELVIFNCPNLKKIQYENSKTLKIVKIDDVSCQKVEFLDFGGCSKLDNFDISNRFPNLKECLLYGVNIKSIDVRSSAELEFCMFNGNSNLIELYLPDIAINLTSIFISDTPNLGKIELPKILGKNVWIEQ